MNARPAEVVGRLLLGAGLAVVAPESVNAAENDIAGGIDDEQFAELRQAYVDYGVIFLRDQEITPEQHIAFAQRWGRINVNRFFQAVETHPVIAEVIGRFWAKVRNSRIGGAPLGIIVPRSSPAAGS